MGPAADPIEGDAALFGFGAELEADDVFVELHGAFEVDDVDVGLE